MIELLPGIFEITLTERPGSTNQIQLYLIKGTERNLLIDAAYSNDWCRRKLLDELENEGIQPEKLDVFLTHKHADHCGLAHELEKRGAVIYMNREEDRHQYDCLYYKLDHSDANAQLRVLKRSGITQQLAPLIWEKYMDANHHLAEQDTVWKMTVEAFTYENILPGQIFAYGDYRFEAIPLRGHTFGQMGLVDKEKRLFFSGDQLLNRTAPIVGTSHADEHLLRHYLESLRSLAEQYSGYTILPAHEGPIEDLAAVRDRVIRSYDRKLHQTEAFVQPQAQTVWQIAKQVYGLTPAKRSDEAFYNAKLITSKTFSMLEYLYDQGAIQRREKDGTLYWWKEA